MSASTCGRWRHCEAADDIGNVDVKPGSQGSDSQGLPKEAIDQIVAAASTEEDKKSMAALASTASADGTIGVKVMGQDSLKKQRPEPPALPVPAPQIALFPMGSNYFGEISQLANYGQP